MPKITRDSLLTLEAYARERTALRTQVIAHKRHRTLALGAHITLLFEDELTMRYQIQEMLRIERIFEAVGIQEELDTYNALVPDGDNWKATMMIEYPDVAQRVYWLTQLRGIEHRVWARVGSSEPVFAVADEDMIRHNDLKTSAVHFLRFPLTPPLMAALQAGAPLAMGVEHARYVAQADPVSATLRQALLQDLAV